jgi:hypothetical protein
MMAHRRVGYKFYLGQQVEYRPPQGRFSSGYVVTAKLPKRDGQFEYRISNVNDAQEGMARESELRALVDRETAF